MKLKLFCLYLLASAVAHAQSLDELAQISRDAQIVERCTKLGEKASQIDLCKRFRPTPVSATSPSPKSRAKQDDQVSITVLSAWGVGGTLNCEVSINDSTRVLTVGETFQDWTLIQLDEYQATFKSAAGFRRVIAYRTGPKLSAVPETGRMPLGNPGPMPGQEISLPKK